MTEVYVIGNGIVILSYPEYIRYCKDKGIKPAYNAPK
jgi:hypothetical protein